MGRLPSQSTSSSCLAALSRLRAGEGAEFSGCGRLLGSIADVCHGMWHDGVLSGLLPGGALQASLCPFQPRPCRGPFRLALAVFQLLVFGVLSVFSVEVVEGIPRLTWEWIWMASIKRGGLVSGSVGCLYDRETRGRKRRAIGVSLFPVLAGVR